MRRVLVVDDDRRMRRTLQIVVEHMGLESVAVADAAEARAQLGAMHFDLVLTDLKMPETSGITLLEEIRLEQPKLPVILITAYGTIETAIEAMQKGASDFVLKPFEEKELHVAIEMALYRHEMDRRLEESERWLAATLKSIGESVIATDADWRIRFMNPAAELLTGWESSHAAGRDLADVVRVSIPFKPRAVETGDLPGGGGVARGVLVTRDGKEVSVEERSTLIRDEDGAVIGIVIALRDLGEKIRKARGT